MPDTITFGTSKRGKRTAIYKNYEYWNFRNNAKGQTEWRCCKKVKNKCNAKLLTEGENVIEQKNYHNHLGNEPKALARSAIGKMKEKMIDGVTTPDSVQKYIRATLNNHVLDALPSPATVNKCLRTFLKKSRLSNNSKYSDITHQQNFDILEMFNDFILYDSRFGPDRIIIIGDNELLHLLSRCKTWLTDGTFKTVPTIPFQLYTIHFAYVESVNPAAVYCLLPNKEKCTFDRILTEIKTLIPSCEPCRIITDFDKAEMSAYSEAFPSATISNCYFHLYQSILQKLDDLGMKRDFESNIELRTSIRCLASLAHVPPQDVPQAFNMLAKSMPPHDKIGELLSYFEHTYIRGKLEDKMQESSTPALFPISSWNKFKAATEGIARTSHITEGWHTGLESILMCSHLTIWNLLKKLKKDCCKQKNIHLNTTSEVEYRSAKRYRTLHKKVTRAVNNYEYTNVMFHLRYFADISH